MNRFSSDHISIFVIYIFNLALQSSKQGRDVTPPPLIKIKKKIKSREDFKTSSFPLNYLFTYTVHIIKTSKLLLPNPHNVRGPESTCGPSATSGLTDPWRCKNAAPPLSPPFRICPGAAEDL